MGRGSAALPVIRIVEYDVETAAGQRVLHRFGSLRSACRFSTRLPRSCLFSAMQNRDIVAFLQQLGDKEPPDEHSSANYQNLHLNPYLWGSRRCLAAPGSQPSPSCEAAINLSREPPVSLVVIFQTKVSNQCLTLHPAECILQLHQLDEDIMFGV